MSLRNTLRKAKRQDFPVPGARIPFTIERTKDIFANNPIYSVYRKDMPDQKVGYAKLSGDGKSVMDVNIAPIFQRQGIASALYDFIERDQRITLRPSPMWQSAAGKAFWAARRNRPVTEDLRDWFGKGKQGGVGGGGWDRYNTRGERIGKCGDAEERGGEGEGKPKCLSKQKAAQLRAQGGKKAIANAVKRKKAQDPVTDRKGTGNAPRPISNRIGEAMLAEKNVPTNPSLWSRAKAEAKKRFDVYPCVPLDSLAITKSGPVSYEDLNLGDEILTYNMATDVLEWKPVLHKHYYEDAPLVEIGKPTGFSIRCTPNHKWVVETNTERKLVETQHLNTHMRLLMCATLDNPSTLFLGEWSKHDNWIERILSMNSNQREVFLASSVVYDGWDKGRSSRIKNRHTFGFSQKEYTHLWSSLLAAFLNGYYVTYRERETITGATYIRNKRTHSTQNLYKKDAGTDAVWCPTTENETWVMIQNGIITITGNSAYANGWAAKWYKKRGGGWKSEKTESYDMTDPSQREWGTDSSVAIFKSMTPGEMQESSHTVLDKPTPSVKELAQKHQVTVDQIEQQLAKGMKVEREHTSDESTAREIALDHLAERPDYYDQLAKIESREMVREFKQGKHVVLLATPKNPNDGDGKGYWKVGTEVYRGPVKNPQFDATGAPMDKRWESSFSHFERYFDGVYAQHYKKSPAWKSNLKEELDTLVEIIFESLRPSTHARRELLQEAYEDWGELNEAAEYQGRKVQLRKPWRTPDGPKKFSVYVKNEKGNVVKVNFGDPKLSIKRDDPDRRRNFRARHGCDNPGPVWKAKYWSCKFWSKKSVTDLIKETPKK